MWSIVFEMMGGTFFGGFAGLGGAIWSASVRLPAILALPFSELFGIELLQGESGFDGSLQLLELCRGRLIQVFDLYTSAGIRARNRSRFSALLNS